MKVIVDLWKLCAEETDVSQTNKVYDTGICVLLSTMIFKSVMDPKDIQRLCVLIFKIIKKMTKKNLNQIKGT